jgi:hypothetical protein
VTSGKDRGSRISSQLSGNVDTETDEAEIVTEDSDEQNTNDAESEQQSADDQKEDGKLNGTKERGRSANMCSAEISATENPVAKGKGTVGKESIRVFTEKERGRVEEGESAVSNQEDEEEESVVEVHYDSDTNKVKNARDGKSREKNGEEDGDKDSEEVTEDEEGETQDDVDSVQRENRTSLESYKTAVFTDKDFKSAENSSEEETNNGDGAAKNNDYESAVSTDERGFQSTKNSEEETHNGKAEAEEEDWETEEGGAESTESREDKDDKNAPEEEESDRGRTESVQEVCEVETEGATGKRARQKPRKSQPQQGNSMKQASATSKQGSGGAREDRNLPDKEKERFLLQGDAADDDMQDDMPLTQTSQKEANATQQSQMCSSQVSEVLVFLYL